VNFPKNPKHQFKPAVVQLKTLVAPPTVKRPVAPPVYRPQPVPKVLQTKSALPASPQKFQPPPSPAAPPIYRPQPTPTVLQAKRLPAHTIQARPLTPPVTHRPSSVPKIVQTKTVAKHPTLPVRPSAIVQLAEKKKKGKDIFVRTPFSGEVKSSITLEPGEHRRHIIPNHLMKHMFQRWWNAHKNDEEGELTSFRELQGILKDMNNYMPNLVPGEGAANTAIGMLATAIGGALKDIQDSKLSAKEIAAKLSKYRGFAQWKQEELMEGVLLVFAKDKEVKASAEERIELAGDIHGSVDFDWPGGKHWDLWFGTYERFKEIEESPEDFDHAELMAAVNKFESLPVVRDRRDRSPARGRPRARARTRRRSESRDDRSLSPDQRGAASGGGSRDRSRSRDRGSGPASRTRSRRSSS